MKLTIVVLLSMLLPGPALAESFISIEGGLTYQSRNDQRIPGQGGTDFSLVDFDGGPFPSYRIYVGHLWNQRHELRALYAPFELELDGQLSQTVSFAGSTFAANTETQALYKFNSYRFTYAYHFEPLGAWRLALGFTGKIRDAEVRLTQGTLSAKKNNVGFVPLLNFQAVRPLATDWSFRFDFDGLAAPQGRAFDLALFLERAFGESGLKAFAGYRTVEGGADNKEVYNFAWIHTVTVGLRGEF